jgi:hypothetical protein
MSQIEYTIKTYDQTGLIKTETYMGEEPISLEQKIEQKEQDLLRMYNALEELKKLRPE